MAGNAVDCVGGAEIGLRILRTSAHRDDVCAALAGLCSYASRGEVYGISMTASTRKPKRNLRAQAVESRWGRHFILRARRGSQVIERVCGYGGSNKLFSVERNTITEEQLLQPLLLIERRLQPEIRRSR
jgi:sarcosine oxidase delta subunit